MDRVGAWLDAQTKAWRWVDPETFTRACIELEVWTPWKGADAIDAMRDYFGEDEALAAGLRFLNVAAALEDDTLVEFVYDTDDDQIAIPTAIFWTGATTPYDDLGESLEPCVWRRSILARLEVEP